MIPGTFINVVLLRENSKFLLQLYNCDQAFFTTGNNAGRRRDGRMDGKWLQSYRKTQKRWIKQWHQEQSYTRDSNLPLSLTARFKGVTFSEEESRFLPADALCFLQNLKSFRSDNLCLNYNFLFFCCPFSSLGRVVVMDAQGIIQWTQSDLYSGSSEHW